MDPRRESELLLTRRQLFGRAAAGIGTAALASLLCPEAFAAALSPSNGLHGELKSLHFKPKLKEYHGQELPATIRMGQRITGMTSGQKSFPCVAPMFQFAQHGKSGTWVSELLPHTAKIADDICIIKSMHTEAINHDPGITYIQTGSQQPGRPSIGAW